MDGLSSPDKIDTKIMPFWLNCYHSRVYYVSQCRVTKFSLLKKLHPQKTEQSIFFFRTLHRPTVIHNSPCWINILPHYCNTKIFKFGWKLFNFWGWENVSYPLSWGGIWGLLCHRASKHGNEQITKMTVHKKCLIK